MRQGQRLQPELAAAREHRAPRTRGLHLHHRQRQRAGAIEHDFAREERVRLAVVDQLEACRHQRAQQLIEVKSGVLVVACVTLRQKITRQLIQDGALEVAAHRAEPIQDPRRDPGNVHAPRQDSDPTRAAKRGLMLLTNEGHPKQRTHG